MVSRSMTKDLSPGERAFIASSVRSAVDLVFAHWISAPRFDLDERYRQLLDTTLTRGDRRRFSLEMAAFLAALQNGHTKYCDAIGWRPYAGALGFEVAPVDSAWVITKAWRPGFRAGQVLERVDGGSPEDLYQESKRYISASSERGRRRRLFAETHLFPRRLRLQVDGRRMVLGRTPGVWDAPREGTTGKWLDRGRVAYLRIPSFREPEHEQRALGLVRRFRRAPALVIDVRGNTGGSDPDRLIESLMDRPWRGMAVSTTQHIGSVRAYAHLLEMADQRRGPGLHVSRDQLASLEVFRAWDHFQLLVPPKVNPPRPGAYAGRVLLLADEACGSACEDFLIPFKNSGRGSLVGTTTDGTTGQPYILDLPKGIQACVGAKRTSFPDGSPFEGTGIAPDHEVRATRDDLLEGRDPALEMATELATRTR
jgi:carboxyl-terminal processing protease